MIKQQCFSLLKNQKKQLLNFHIKWKHKKIINLLNDSSNEQSKFATKRFYVIDSQTAKGQYKQGDTINLKQKLLNQVFVIILMHLLQLQEILQ